MQVNDIYTPIEDVRKILEERWNNVELRKKVLEFLGNDLPSYIQETPHAITCRHLASPDAEFREFLSLAKEIKLTPLCLEYIQDKFVSHNEDKYYFGKMLFDFGLGKKGGRKIESINIIDFNSSNGKKISDLETVWGEDFVDFHHGLLIEGIKEKIEIRDFSDWIKRNGSKAEIYYKKYLTIFVCFGVLFENFFNWGDEADLTNNLVLKNIDEIQKQFGVKPIIVKIANELEGDLFWYTYESFLKKIISDKI